MSDIHINRVKQAVASAPGTGIAVLGSAQTGFQALGAAQDGGTVSVLWIDGADWEIATGCTYTDAASTLSRGTREDSSTGARLSLTSAAVMAVIAPASRGTAWDAAAVDAAAAAAAVAALATVATSGDYADLTGKPTLGTAAAQNTTAFATAAQGTKADGAAQIAGDLGGTAATPVVAKINGVAVTGTPTVGQVPTATSGTAATWQTPSGGGGSPGGSSGEFQRNSSGSFAGSNLQQLSTGQVAVTPFGSVTDASLRVGVFSGTSYNTGLSNTNGNELNLLAGGVTVVQVQSTGITVFRGVAGFAGTISAGQTIDIAYGRNATGVIEINNGTAGTFRDMKLRNLIATEGVQLTALTVGTLPAAASNTWKSCAVSDANAPTVGATVASGGSAKAVVRSNGTNWIVTEVI